MKMFILPANISSLACGRAESVLLINNEKIRGDKLVFSKIPDKGVNKKNK